MRQAKQRMLSGVKPTGDMHIGNYFGMVKQMVDMQDQYETFIFIPDYHALISIQDKQTMESLIMGVATNLLACGIDPDRVIMYKQSDVPVVAEACWVFNCLTTMPQLMRGHAFKDHETKNKDVSVGLFDYPVLQTADIVLFDTDIVPVGEDQRQHIEMAREIVRKFNNTFGDTFVEPQAKIKTEVGTIIGSDGQKMSKSYGNTLPLFATEQETTKYIKGIAMDSKDITEQKNPDDYVLYTIARLFCTAEQNAELRAMFSDGGVGYGDIKTHVVEVINNYTRPLRERRKELAADPDYVKHILNVGGEKARAIAEPKMQEIRERVGFNIN